ncbi:DUF6883 domain-containing protein [Micromonospora sp. NPDC023888]|uniref:DUF6883 domain-containing protein n=1 Tax=Micromonospora sp. NPDC023888 TaxID=3155607 RepID=UPI00340B5651
MTSAPARPGPPIALFVDAHDPTLRELSEYGPAVKHAVLGALLPLDPRRELQVQTWWGSLMLPVFRLAEADTAGAVTFDQDLFLLWSSATRLVHDGDACWSRPAATVPWLLGTSTRIYLGILTGLPVGLHEALHTALTDQGWYLGMMNVETDNALHHQVFDLIKAWRYNRGFIADNPVHLRPQEVFDGLPVQFGPGPDQWPGCDLALRWRPATLPGPRHPQTYQEALAEAVARYGEAERPLTFAVGRRSPVIADLEGKLHGYALNPTHSVGGPKAVFFATALGLRQNDWRLLAVQLISALDAGAPQKFRDESRFGSQQHLRFEISAPVFGLNGRTAIVTAAWKIEDDGPVQLVTVTPGKKQGIVEQDDALQDGNLAGLYAIAVEVADAARLACRPTPLAVAGGPDGDEIHPEGLVGFAWVRFPDPVAPLAAWLVAHHHGTLGEGRVTVGCPTFDYEPAIAWATAFAGVMQAAGHTCTVDYEVD